VTETPACKHERTRLIAKDNEAEYIECIHCGAILETHEMAEASIAANPKSNTAENAESNPHTRPEPVKSNSFDESLSDA
jgi:Zn ribbon nucleic-acid-binding protein